MLWGWKYLFKKGENTQLKRTVVNWRIAKIFIKNINLQTMFLGYIVA